MSDLVLAERTAKVARELDALTVRAFALEADGDRVPYFLRASVVFNVLQNTSGEIVFNVPMDAHFYGRRLNLFLSGRVVSTAPATPFLTELTYRPVDWTSVGFALGGAGIDASEKVANCVFHISDSVREAYQRAPIAIMSAFSGRVVNPIALNANAQLPIAPFVGGLDFHTDYVLRRGSTMTVRITPSFSFWAGAVDASDTFQYRVMGVFQGYKKAKALR